MALLRWNDGIAVHDGLAPLQRGYVVFQLHRTERKIVGHKLMGKTPHHFYFFVKF